MVLLVPAVSGCLARWPWDADDRAAPVRTAAANDGVPLSAYMTGGYHRPRLDAQLRPNAPDPGPAPARCAALRGPELHAADRCLVEGSRELPSGGRAPWTLSAAWTFKDWDELDAQRDGRRALAFDAAGRTVAWWAGATDPDAGYYTE